MQTPQPIKNPLVARLVIVFAAGEQMSSPLGSALAPTFAVRKLEPVHGGGLLQQLQHFSNLVQGRSCISQDNLASTWNGMTSDGMKVIRVDVLDHHLCHHIRAQIM